jgi:hypothetical protein
MEIIMRQTTQSNLNREDQMLSEFASQFDLSNNTPASHEQAQSFSHHAEPISTFLGSKTLHYLLAAVGVTGSYISSIWNSTASVTLNGFSVINAMFYSTAKTIEVNKKNEHINNENQNLAEGMGSNREQLISQETYVTTLTYINRACAAAHATGTGLLAYYEDENSNGNHVHLYAGASLAATSAIVSAGTHVYVNSQIHQRNQSLYSEQKKLYQDKIVQLETDRKNETILRQQAENKFHDFVIEQFNCLMNNFENNLHYVEKNFQEILANQNQKKHFSDELKNIYMQSHKIYSENAHLFSHDQKTKYLWNVTQYEKYCNQFDDSFQPSSPSGVSF